jgi:hypothetical protein
MENWYLPVTIIPGIGLIILSTSNLLINLSNEIKALLAETLNDDDLIQRKLHQLKLLNRAMVFLYLAVAFFIISGLISGFFTTLGLTFNSSIYVVILGIICALLALLFLIKFSFKAVKIRQNQFYKKSE